MSEKDEMIEMAKSALRKAFPGTKLSVQTSGRIRVKWSDDGPTVEQVKDVVLTIGGVEADFRGGERRLRVSNGHGSFYFDRYSVKSLIEREEWRHWRSRRDAGWLRDRGSD
jgi:hypothetical protein